MGRGDAPGAIVGPRKRIVVAAAALGLYLASYAAGVAFSAITGISDRVSLLAVTALAVCFVAALGIRTRRSRRR